MDSNYDISYVAGTVTVNPALASATTTTTGGTTTAGTTSAARPLPARPLAARPLAARPLPARPLPARPAGTTTATGTANPPQPTAANKPKLISLSPVAGPMAGGTTVVIRGKWFDDMERVRFGTRTARFKVVSAEEVIAYLPAGAGTVAVSVKTAAGTSPGTKRDDFTYLARSDVLQLSPAAGAKAGGTTVVIRGMRFEDVERVRFGTRTARFKVVSAEEVIAHSPPGSGTVTVLVTTAGGTSARTKPDDFTYGKK